jgi:hypothetical protein
VPELGDGTPDHKPREKCRQDRERKQWKKWRIAIGMRISWENEKGYDYWVRPDWRDLAALYRKLNQKNGRSKKLFSTQWDDDFLISAKKNHMTIINRLNGDLIDLRSQLQTKLLPFTHRSAVNDRVMCLWIERDG